MEKYLNPKSPAKLGFGVMRLPEDFAETCRMFDMYLDGGGDYFDTAWIYGNSEETLGRGLVARHARDKFLLADKLPPWQVKNHADCEKLFTEQLRRCRTDFFDFYLVHSIDDNREDEIENHGLFEYVAEQKKKGRVRHMGFSFHGTAECLARVLKRHPEAEFVLLQLNYADMLRGPAGQWHKVAADAGIAIQVMEPIKGGSLVKLPATAEQILRAQDPQRSMASWALQYAAGLDGVTCVLSGMSSEEHVRDNLHTFENFNRPLTPQETDALTRAMDETAKVAGIPCTACKYCHAPCPQGIDIASCFSLYNDKKRDDGWNVSMMYKTIPPGRRAEDCTLCGICNPHCPQKIDIPKSLHQAAQAFK
jgi:predicted aldo/keto reductase-like oxidoreductase